MKTPRPEHGSFLCPPQPSLRFHHLSISLDGFICACYLGSYWISLCLHLVSVSVTVPERLLAEFMLCIYFSPPPHPPLHPCMPFIPSLSWPKLDTSECIISSSAACFYHTPSLAPSSLTAAKSTGALPCFILLLLFITLGGFGLCCCRPSTAVWKNAAAQQMCVKIPPQV